METEGHFQRLRRLAVKTGVENIPLAVMPVTKSPNKSYSINRDSFQHGDDICEAGLLCYTDGSKLMGKARAGWHLTSCDGKSQTPLKYAGFPLGEHATVFEAEITAISDACITFLHYNSENLSLKSFKKIIFLSDSQAAIKALDSKVLSNKFVWDAITALNHLANHINVEIRWIKAHVGHLGNEAADDHAKSGTIQVTDFCLPMVPVSH